MKKISILIISIITLLNINTSLAQQRNLNKEVDVRTNYRPKINKSNRIGELPIIVDTAKFVPSFQYLIQTRPLPVSFAPAKIRAMQLPKMPVPEQFLHSLILAGGNYATLFGDYCYQSNRDDEFNFGVHLQHYSQNGKLEMNDNTKVKPNYVNQLAELYGMADLDNILIGGKLFFKHTGANYYGFRTKDIASDLEQLRTNNLGLSANFQTNFKDEEQLNFGAELCYEFFGDKYKANNNAIPQNIPGLPDEVTEDDITLTANARLRRGEGLWSATTTLNYFTTNHLDLLSNYKTDSKRKTFVWQLKPQYLLQKGNLNLQLGLNTILAAGDDSKAKIYPDIKVDLEAIPDFITVFAGINGNLEMNRYKDIVAENLFVFSGLNVMPANMKYNIFGGVRSSISHEINLQFTAEYAKIDNQYFFMAGQTPGFFSVIPFPYTNKFRTVYDNISRFKLSVGSDVKWNNQLDFYGRIDFYAYNMNVLEKPFHRPTFKAEIAANYKFNEKLTFTGGLDIVGKRWAKVNEKLKASYCLNLGANYDINKNISAFAQINNFFGTKYYKWQGYPAEKLNFLLGAAIRF